MIFLKQILLLIGLITLCKFVHSEKLKNNAKKLNRSNDSIINGNRPIEPIIKNSMKPKDRKSRRVTFADQVLDDKIGTEPLDVKLPNHTCTQGDLRKADKENNSFKNLSFPNIKISAACFFFLILAIF